MSDNQDNHHDTSASEVPEDVSSARRKQWLPLFVLFLAFVGIVTLVFLTQKKETIDWIEDYQAGIKLSEQQNKPILLVFHNQNVSFCWAMEQHVYNHPDAIKYVEANFIPILIDIDKQPEIIKKYNVSYYPTFYVKYPDSNELSAPIIGCIPKPKLFIERISKLLDTIKQPNK